MQRLIKINATKFLLLIIEGVQNQLDLTPNIQIYLSLDINTTIFKKD